MESMKLSQLLTTSMLMDFKTKYQSGKVHRFIQEFVRHVNFTCAQVTATIIYGTLCNNAIASTNLGFRFLPHIPPGNDFLVQSNKVSQLQKLKTVPEKV